MLKKIRLTNIRLSLSLGYEIKNVIINYLCLSGFASGSALWATKDQQGSYSRSEELNMVRILAWCSPIIRNFIEQISIKGV
jgi:hypothetical protein